MNERYKGANSVTLAPVLGGERSEGPGWGEGAKRCRRPAATFLLLALHGLVLAQVVVQERAPNTQEMIEALKPRTRSIRNLVVTEVAASAPSAAAAASQAAPAGTDTVSVNEAASRPSLSMAIRFDFDSARLRPEGAAVLDRLAAALQTPELKDSRFLIEGHTDAKGAADYNLRLSQQRADEARRYLMAHGVSGQRLDAAGRGAQEPATPAAQLAAENRRVRIVNID